MLFCALAICHTPTATAAAWFKKKVIQEAPVAAVTLHTGQKIANFFRTFGIPDIAILAIISAMPVVELRGAIPVGIWMGLPIPTVLAASIFGNMVPIIPILLLLKNSRIQYVLFFACVCLLQLIRH